MSQLVGPGRRIDAWYRSATGSHGACSRARSSWLARLIHCPTAVNRSFPAAVNAQTATATKARQRVDPPLRRARVRQHLQPLPRARGKILPAGTGLDHPRPHARQ
jgi:hypothetical protein